MKQIVLLLLVAFSLTQCGAIQQDRQVGRQQSTSSQYNNTNDRNQESTTGRKTNTTSTDTEKNSNSRNAPSSRSQK